MIILIAAAGLVVGAAAGAIGITYYIFRDLYR